MPYTRFQEQTIARLSTLKKTVMGENGHVGYDGFGHYSFTNIPEDKASSLKLLLTRVVQDGKSGDITAYTTPGHAGRVRGKYSYFTTSVFVKGRAIDLDKLKLEIAKIENPYVARTVPSDIGCDSGPAR